VHDAVFLPVAAVERAGVHDVLLFRRNASRALFSFEETVVNGAIMVQPPLYYTIATREIIEIGTVDEIVTGDVMMAKTRWQRSIATLWCENARQVFFS
jgi:hypothetical protein